MTAADILDSFPRQSARTQRYTLGEPRNLVVSPDGQRIVFARSRAGDDPVNCLWVLDVSSGEERLVADPISLLDGPDIDGDEPAEERARRERAREAAGGITAFATDREVRVCAFALAGRLFVAGLISGAARELTVDGAVFDPRPDPVATRVAYTSGRTLRIAELDGSSWELAGEAADEHVSWGTPDFIAAEEMRRFRGYWWSPDGTHIVAARVDESPVGTWYVSDPAHPEQPPTALRYPAAGTDNANTTLHVLALDGGAVSIEWDRDTYPYVADVRWTRSDLLVTVQSRDQRELCVLSANPVTGDTAVRWLDHDDVFIELVPGSPTLLVPPADHRAAGDNGWLVVAADRDGARRLLVDGTAVTPIDLQVRSIIHAADAAVTFLANPIDDATVQHVWRWTASANPDQPAELSRLTDQHGQHGATVGGTTTVIRTATMDDPGASTAVLGGPALRSCAAVPLVTPNIAIRYYGERRLHTAVLLPRDHDGSALPVLVDSYGGPHAQRVIASYNAMLSSQWFADQGFAVVVIDGRGTPGRGSEWERCVYGDLATAALDDQVEALHAAAAEFPLDLQRVGIRGWSFGGYLAALAVLRRPDVFHTAVAGAPVTEWRLYDTHYTERYLGDPTVDAAPYAASSLLPLAGELTRPLLLVHGLADDNVVAAHTLQLSSALLAAGKPHEVLPLVGVTHMTSQEVVAEHLMLHQLDFLRRTMPVAAAPQPVKRRAARPTPARDQ
jgi:dipeptidyl-peptidase 4